MAIIVDPDSLDRFDVVYGPASQKISIYPVGSTQRNSSVAYTDVWIDTSGNIERSAAFGGGVVVGDVVAIMNTVNAGHYYVNTVSSNILTLTDIDTGTGGAATTNLTPNTNSFTAPGAVGTDQLTVTAHGYITGDRVVFDDDGGTAPTGLTNGNVYYIIRIDANTVALATSHANAIAGTSISITASTGSGAQKLQERAVVAIFTNGANSTEAINGNNTSGDGTGTVIDGLTLQAGYSFSKEEWRVDSIANDDLNGNYDANDYYDDLIRHEFPFEAITSEQFEIGGGTAHADWNWFNDYTRKKVRTGGHAEKITAGTTQAEYAGVITLGSLDPDTQVYFQQVNEAAAPTDFTFLGAVNESVQTFTNPTPDNRTYLKLFARKKGRTYAQSEISDIGVTTIQPIVNRFPLAHAVDAAIIAEDAEILGTSPWRSTTVVISDTVGGAADGVTADVDGATGTFTITTGDFNAVGAEIVIGDTLQITTANADIGYYTVLDVDVGGKVLTVDTSESGAFSGTASNTYNVATNIQVADKVTVQGTASDLTTAGVSNGILETGTPGVGTFTDTDNGDFINDGVVAGSIVFITNSVGSNGLYKVLDSATAGASDPTATVLYVRTVDQTFPGVLEGAVDYQIFKAGMFLQYKKDTIQVTSTITAVNYDNSNATYGGRPTITLTGETWDADITAGSIVEVTNSSLNDGSYTVFARETAAIVSLVPTDVLVDESDAVPTTDISVFDGFSRDIGGTIYSYNWRLFGNSGSLSQAYEFVQHELRLATDIDYGAGVSRGDVTDLLLAFATPTGNTFNMFIDNIDSADINNTTYQDHSGVNRNFPFLAAGRLIFNDNLSSDANATYRLFFTNDDSGDNLGRDFGTKNALTVQDADDVEIAGSVSAQSEVAFTFDYDGNIQRGSSSAGTNAPVTLVAIGLDTAQYVITTGTITRSTSVTISAVAALERNYSNP